MPKVFFSWQSDHSPSQCKTLIRSALDSAARSLSSSVSEANRTEIVSDTQGIGGSPEIFKAICDQIDQCDVFVADLSAVAETKKDGHRKVLPNSNVLIEYGYALKSKGRYRIIAVMNEACFEPKIEELPFNLKHARGPFRYWVGPETESKESAKAAEKLEKFFVEAIGAVFKSLPPQADDQTFAGQPALPDDPSTFLRANEIITRDGDFNGQTLKVVLETNRGNIYARLIPKRALELSKREIRQRVVEAPGLDIATSSSSGSEGNNEYGYVSYAILNTADSGRRTVLDFVQYFKSGEVWCVNGSTLNNTDSLTEGIFSVVNRMLVVCRNWLRSAAPSTEYSLVVGVTGLKGKRIMYGYAEHQKTSQFYDDHFSSRFEKPRELTTQQIKDVLWAKMSDAI